LALFPRSLDAAMQPGAVLQAFSGEFDGMASRK
jgi:hypothetical protein